MNVGIIGSGGREHAICERILYSKHVNNVYCFPGNAGTEKMAINIDVDFQCDFNTLKNICFNKNIRLLVVGPEQPLVNGIVDYFADTDIMVFGPNQIASQLEGSKLFTKKLCETNTIPTAKYVVCTVNNIDSYMSQNTTFPIVIKVDGLAAGKGVYVCNNSKESETAIQEIVSGKIGICEEILIEEFLKGEEMSFFIISDGDTYKPFCTAQDHKRVLEGDKGKNTGGMGCVSPSIQINEVLEEKICKRIIEPTLIALKRDYCTNYVGFLYAGLMICENDEPYLIEYNVRMGDPECQTIIPRLKTDFLQLIQKCCTKELSTCAVDFLDTKSLCTVLCAKGYPDKYETDVEIDTNKVKLKQNQFIYHAGTKKTDDDMIVSNGGRVLNVVSLTDSVDESRKEVLEVLETLGWSNGYYRRDIGCRKTTK